MKHVKDMHARLSVASIKRETKLSFDAKILQSSTTPTNSPLLLSLAPLNGQNVWMKVIFKAEAKVKLASSTGSKH